MNRYNVDVLTPIAAGFLANGSRGVLDAVHEHPVGTCNGDVSHAWALAMTAWFGPTGLHISWTDQENGGRPTAKCLAECPGVARKMELALAELERFLAPVPPPKPRLPIAVGHSLRFYNHAGQLRLGGIVTAVSEGIVKAESGDDSEWIPEYRIVRIGADEENRWQESR